MYKSPVDPPPLHFPKNTWEQLIALLAKYKATKPMELEDEYDNE
jgi:ABC-type glycerol-3-phosphate transport system substrate-binding protein